MLLSERSGGSGNHVAELRAAVVPGQVELTLVGLDRPVGRSGNHRRAGTGAG